MQTTRNIAETEVISTDSLTACNICKINKGIKQPIRPESGKSEITERPHFVSTDLLGSVTPMARGNHLMVKNCNHYTSSSGSTSSRRRTRR